MPRHIFTHTDRRRGGHNLVSARGVEHMRTIGRKGAQAFWKLYTVKPAGQSGWVILTRDTQKVVNFIGSVPGATRRVTPTTE